MAKKRENGSGRLLDTWEPLPDAGEPIGCVATTFTFDPVFFEEHCLARFLGLESDSREDGAAYLIEREERLANVRVSVMVDQSTADASASSRWDVLRVRVPGGILHAKIALLAWARCIRLIIGSANLTEPAYRKNQEIFGVLDLRDGGEVPTEILQTVIGFLGALATYVPGGATEMGPRQRLRTLLDLVGRVSQGIHPNPPKIRESPHVMPILLGQMEPYRRSVLERLGLAMRERGGPATAARVVSPFFDKPTDSAYAPTTDLLAALTDRGQRFVEMYIPGETLPDGRLRLRAPAAILRPQRKRAEFKVHRIREDAEDEARPLHAKSVWLWNDGWHVYMIGSSNFTGAGLGLEGVAPNAEANLAFVFPDDTGVVRRMRETLPPAEGPIETLDTVLWEPVEDDKREDQSSSRSLPVGFVEALFDPQPEGGGRLILWLGENLPEDWGIRIPGREDLLYANGAWLTTGRPQEVTIPWSERGVPRALDVRWTSKTGERLSAVWPVNVTDMSRLPAPDDLRNLSLDTLIDILGSRRPLHEAVLAFKRRAAERAAAGQVDRAAEIDPHRRVRTETFLLQRTRRVARAIEQLVERMNRPIAHREALVWRLRGPVGPVALAQALMREAKSEGEACFLVSEVVLALRRVRIPLQGSGLSETEVSESLATVRAEIAEMANCKMREGGSVPSQLADYVSAALKETTT